MFDRNQLIIEPLANRKHDLNTAIIRMLKGAPLKNLERQCKVHSVADRMIFAKGKGASIIMMIGAHVIRSGVQNYLIDLMKRGYVSCLAMNGAGMIHDFELALVGATTESVARYIGTGQFGLWKETGILNDIINKSYRENPSIGMGEAVGAAISLSEYPYNDISLLCAGHRLGVPVTVHVGIGYDIVHELPNCDGAATGALSLNDFLIFAETVESIERGVLMNFGSAVMGPEIFLKALSMARNVAHQNGSVIQDFTTLVCDLKALPEDISIEPPRESAEYYFRPWKTLLVRTLSNGGESFYVQGKHDETIPALWNAINEAEKNKIIKQERD